MSILRGIAICFIILLGVVAVVFGYTYISAKNQYDSWPPVLRVSPTNGAAPLQVNITVDLHRTDHSGEASIDYTNHPIIDVNFGDGSDKKFTGLDPITGSLQTTHIYMKPGTYTIIPVESFQENNIPNPVRDLASQTVVVN